MTFEDFKEHFDNKMSKMTYKELMQLLESDSKKLNKFSININSLSDKVFYECIIQKSKFSIKNEINDFYTFQGRPKDYFKTIIADIRGADKVFYKNRLFYVVRYKESILWIFHQHNVYYFDPYFQDCPIFNEIINNYN